MESVDKPLHPTTWATFRMLRAGARLSRNRHFYLFEDPRARRGLRLHRYLKSVVADVERYAETMAVTRTDDRYALRLDFPLLRGHRTAYLSGVELELLAEQAPQVAQLLAELATSSDVGGVSVEVEEAVGEPG